MKFFFPTLLLTAVLCLLAENSAAQNFNRPVPDDLYEYEFVQYDSTINFYIGVTPFSHGITPTEPGFKMHRSILLDPNGYLAWYQTDMVPGSGSVNNFQYNEENSVFQIMVMNSAISMQCWTLDQNFDWINSTTPINLNPDSHESLITSNGNTFITTRSDEMMDLSGYTIHGNPGNANTNVRCNGFQEFDQNGNLVFEWNSCDHIHPEESYGFSYNVNNFDYFHINSVEIDKDDGHLLVSARHTNSVIKIHRTTGDVIWRLGGTQSDFTFINDGAFSGQHDARSYGNGVITIHDNGNLATPKVTRGITYQLDTINWTATLIDEFNTGNYGRSMGGYRWIDGYQVINYGRNYRPEPSIQCADTNDNIAFELYFQDDVMSYRGIPFHLDFELPQPSIECLDSNGVTYLRVPNGYNVFKWSSGQTSNLILPTIGETYQFYFPHGAGYMGSLPYTYNGECHSTIGINELSISNQKQLIKITDLLGREIPAHHNEQVYLEVYSDGSVVRIFSID